MNFWVCCDECGVVHDYGAEHECRPDRTRRVYLARDEGRDER